MKEQSVGPIPSTRWTLVERVARGEKAAISEFLRTYSPALRAHLRFKWRLVPDDVHDVLQSFIADRVLERNLLAKADKSLGKLRTFVLVTLDNFVRDRLKKKSLNFGAQDEVEACVEEPDGDVFDFSWAVEVLRDALNRMKVRCEKDTACWGVFEDRVVAPAFLNTSPMAYGSIIQKYGFRSPTEAHNKLATAKRVMRQCLEDAIGDYVDADEVEEELRSLRSILAQVSPFPPETEAEILGDA